MPGRLLDGQRDAPETLGTAPLGSLLLPGNRLLLISSPTSSSQILMRPRLLFSLWFRFLNVILGSEMNSTRSGREMSLDLPGDVCWEEISFNCGQASRGLGAEAGGPLAGGVGGRTVGAGQPGSGGVLFRQRSDQQGA